MAHSTAEPGITKGSRVTNVPCTPNIASVMARRVKAPKLPPGLAPPTHSDMFKGLVGYSSSFEDAVDSRIANWKTQGEAMGPYACLPSISSSIADCKDILSHESTIRQVSGVNAQHSAHLSLNPTGR